MMSLYNSPYSRQSPWKRYWQYMIFHLNSTQAEHSYNKKILVSRLRIASYYTPNRGQPPNNVH